MCEYVYRNCYTWIRVNCVYETGLVCMKYEYVRTKLACSQIADVRRVVTDVVYVSSMLSTLSADEPCEDSSAVHIKYDFVQFLDTNVQELSHAPTEPTCSLYLNMGKHKYSWNPIQLFLYREQICNRYSLILFWKWIESRFPF